MMKIDPKDLAAEMAKAINASPLLKGVTATSTADGRFVDVITIRPTRPTGRVPSGLVKSIFRRARKLERIR